ncbi:MAG: hypothetical protein FJY65_06065 [Calditrichaeota bacterium]|nr:hypothetical protein [Calditrichota bacterium]
MRKKSITLPVAVLILFAFTANLLNAKTWTSISPQNGSKSIATLKVKDKPLSYWKLDKSTPTLIKITGPSVLKVVTRIVLPEKKNNLTYSIAVERDGNKKYKLSRSSKFTKTTTNPKNPAERIAESRSMEFKVPDGEHTFAIMTPKGDKNTIYARFFISNGKKEVVNYIDFKPVGALDNVPIVVKEQEYLYHRVQPGKPVELEVIGPTKIKAFARLEFDHTMRGDKTFRIQVSEGANILQTNPFTGKISAAAAYKTKTDKLLSRGCTFYIEVPAGKHRYKIESPDPGMSVLLRFYLPHKSLGNELGKKKTGNAWLFPVRGNTQG